LSAIKQAVEETDQQILVGSRSENSLETEIGQQTDISFFYLLHNPYVINVSFIGAKLRFSFETNKSFLKKVWKKLVGQSFASVYTICWYFLFIDKR